MLRVKGGAIANGPLWEEDRAQVGLFCGLRKSGGSLGRNLEQVTLGRIVFSDQGIHALFERNRNNSGSRARRMLIPAF